MVPNAISGHAVSSLSGVVRFEVLSGLIHPSAIFAAANAMTWSHKTLL